MVHSRFLKINCCKTIETKNNRKEAPRTLDRKKKALQNDSFTKSIEDIHK